MSYLGDFRLGETFDTKFCTVGTTGAPTTLSSSPVISAYVGNNTTEITAGITLTVDFDSRTGLNNVRVVATSGNGYATASNYQLVITTGTVGGTSVVGYVVAEFSIENRSALMPTTAARTLDVSAGGEAGVDWANVGSQSTSVNLSATTTNVVNTATAVTTVNGLAANVITATAINADAITAAKIANGAIDAATFAADVDAEILSYLVDDATRIDASALNTASGTTIPDILVDTAEIGAAGAGLTAINLPDQTMNITGNITGNLSGSVGSVTGNVGGNVVGEVGSIGAAGIAAASLAAGALNAVADGLLDRNMSAGSDSGTDDGTFRTPRQALRASRNKVSISGGIATVTKEDDTTPSWTAAVTTTAGNPISEVDPT